ncbi:MAG: T9SS type A sorting domain-containing protein [Bacteroidota bacterium]
MKKNLLTLTLICATAAAFAQPVITPMTPVLTKSLNAAKGGNQNSILSVDTLDQYYNRSTSFLLYGVQSGGYIFGTGFSGGLPISDETASHYDGIGNATVTEVLLWCGYKHIAGGNADNLTLNVYSVNADSSANAVLGTGTLTTTDLDTTGLFTSVAINAPITSAFLVSLAYAGIDDTFGLVCNDPSVGDGAGEKRARYLLSASFGGTWRPISDIYVGGLDADVMIIPIVDVPSGVQQFENAAFSLKPVYPSPAKDVINLEYTLHENVNPSFFIMDRSGKTAASGMLETQEGTSVHSVDISQLAAGTYYITFNAGTASLTQKFSVIK